MNFGIFALVGVIMLVLAGASFGYLLQIKNKSRSTWMLIWFFLCVILSSIATILTNTGTTWDWAFAPAQDALLILSGVFLVQFAYTFPANDQPGEARLVSIVFSVLAMAALSYASFFAIRFLSNLSAQLEENQAFYLITPLVILILVLIFFRRSQHCSAQVTNPSQEVKPGEASIWMLLKPKNQPALALRNFGLALAISLIPAVVTISRGALPTMLASFLFNFGVVMAIAALMLVYLNHAPESTTITAKLVGISLVTFLLILGLMSVWFILYTPNIQVHRMVWSFMLFVLMSSFLILGIFPFFFQSALLDPLDRLLNGFRAANEGNLNIQVGVQYEDEIGFITHSFNGLVSSLNDATQALKNESEVLEKQIAERTAELLETNQQLISENVERKNVQTRLDQQLRYEQALACCSQSLLLATEDEKRQQQVLTQAIEHLLEGAQASRVYIFRNIQEPDLGACFGMLAEVCAKDIQPQINNPINQKFPFSQLPKEFIASLEAGNPYGGPVEQIFTSTPDLLINFLNQPEPLLSIQTFPITLNEQWWGFVGFDDCRTPRQWDDLEIRMLCTASEMIGNSIQRWQVEQHLRETLGHLEERIQERTIEYAQANAELKYEIHLRQRFQNELEERLKIERTLAKISANLLSPLELRTAIGDSLADLGQIMQASHVVFIQLPVKISEITGEVMEWSKPGTLPFPTDKKRFLHALYPWFRTQLKNNKSIYLKELATYPDLGPREIAFLYERGIESLLVTPLFVDNQLGAALVCGNPDLPASRLSENLQFVEVVASMLSSQMLRQTLLYSLENKVARRTQELSAFFDMVMLAGEAEEISDIMQPALTKIMEVSACEATLIHLYDEEQYTLRLLAQRAVPSEFRPQVETIHLDESMIKWIEGISWGENSISSDAVTIPDVFRIPGYHSAAQVSLRARGKLQGLLNCYRLDETPFTPYQVTFLSAIGEQLGMAVENYRLRLKAGEVATIHERQRLARELHDAVSQSIYSLALFARSGRDAIEVGDQAKLMDSLEQIEMNSLVALKEMRLLLYQLRSLALESGGLQQAIEMRFDLVERRVGIQASCLMDKSLKFSARVEQELFRLVTEALNNALKHARASQVVVIIQSENEAVVLEVQDDGSGFDPGRAYTGMGLQTMQDRASALGGRFEVSSWPAGGTQIRVEIPQLPILAEES